jgi:hypothetical protein
MWLSRVSDLRHKVAHAHGVRDQVAAIVQVPNVVFLIHDEGLLASVGDHLPARARSFVADAEDAYDPRKKLALPQGRDQGLTTLGIQRGHILNANPIPAPRVEPQPARVFGSGLATCPPRCDLLLVMMVRLLEFARRQVAEGSDEPGRLRSSLRHRASASPRWMAVLARMATGAERAWWIENGADDCVSQPCEQQELLARLRAALRRQRSWQGDPVP